MGIQFLSAFSTASLLTIAACQPAVDQEPVPETPEVVPPVCTYPASTGIDGVGSILPPIGWNNAINDTLGERASLSMEDVYCGKAPFENVDTIFFFLATEWCPNCPAYMTRVGSLTPELEALNAMVVFVDMQRADVVTLPTTEQANTYMNKHTGNGWRVGEADGVVPGSIEQSSIYNAVPNAFVVRTRDMQIIASEDGQNYYLPYLEIAANPEADWSNPPPPPPPPFNAQCTEAEEEVGEPNDVAADATLLSVLSGSVSLAGGICALGPDFFRIELAGDWRLDLGFSNAEGDLDVYVIDVATGEPLSANGNPIGSFGTTDEESISRGGPATIAVVGYNGASANYNLILTDLEPVAGEGEGEGEVAGEGEGEVAGEGEGEVAGEGEGEVAGEGEGEGA